jgi:hypothetical protein
MDESLPYSSLPLSVILCDLCASVFGVARFETHKEKNK